MKASFFGYYPPTEDQYVKLWKEGLIVLDTNVLLNLYRLPNAAREELFGVLEILKERLWIPHQVALEFQRRRLTVISAERKSTEAALKSASDLVDSLKSKVNALELDKRGLNIDPTPLLQDLDKANLNLIEAIKKAHDSQLDISSADSIRDRIDAFLEGRVGPGPKSQEELDKLISDGDYRYREKIPPGFEDIDKDKNPNEASFTHDQIKYPRKFGDLILWRQLIEYANNSDIKYVLLVTADKKEDWWWREQGKTIGPHTELVREITRLGKVDFYWMYSSVQFIEAANKYSGATVSLQSVAELEQVSISHESTISDNSNYSINAQRYVDRLFSGASTSREQTVVDWIRLYYNLPVFFGIDFPDVYIYTNEGIHGFEIKLVKSLYAQIRLINHIISRGLSEILSGKLSAFTLVVVMPNSEFFNIDNRESPSVIINRLVADYSMINIIVGTIIDEHFELLTHTMTE